MGRKSSRKKAAARGKKVALPPKRSRFVIILAAALVLIVVGAILFLRGGADVDNNSGDNEFLETISQKPIVTIEMEEGGQIQVELDPFNAPNTVKNFIALAQSGFYDGLIFHRVIPGFMIQGGCPEGTGRSGPGYSIRGEFAGNGHENENIHERGVISMARTPVPDSAGSQFFITVADRPDLDGEYAAFGTVLEGMDVADRIVDVPRDENDKPLEDQRIKQVTVETFGVTYPPADKI